MKIRTSFVTNSSGSNTSRVMIENEKLLEILRKYKDKMKTCSNNINVMPEVGNNQIIDEKGGNIHDYSYESNTFWNLNNNIDDIKNYYLNRVKYNIYSQGLDEKYPEIINIFNELENELKLNEDEINKSYRNIEYCHEYSGDFGLIGNKMTKTIYNQNNICSKCGNVLLLKDYFVDQYSTYNIKKQDYDDVRTIKHEQYYICSNNKCKYKEIIKKEKEVKEN